MSFNQLSNVSCGRCIDKVLVLSTQPSTVFCSSIRLSALNFFVDIISFRGMISFSSTGRDNDLIARISTELGVVFCVQGHPNTVINVDINFPSLMGISTDVLLAVLKGAVSGMWVGGLNCFSGLSLKDL